MLVGEVTGSVWATKKEESLNGSKLLVVKLENGEVVAADRVGAGIGDKVLVCFGSAARFTVNVPIDTAIVGIIDTVEK